MHDGTAVEFVHWRLAAWCLQPPMIMFLDLISLFMPKQKRLL